MGESAPPAIGALYSEDVGKIRANANLPGQLVYCATKLSNHAMYMEASRSALEKANPGYSKEHLHTGECVAAPCGKWSWRDFGIPDGWNPTLSLITPYCQFSRAESMKGSNQVVALAGERAVGTMDGVGQAPNLSPKIRQESSKPAVLNGAMQHGNGAISEARKEVGLGKRLLGFGGR